MRPSSVSRSKREVQGRIEDVKVAHWALSNRETDAIILPEQMVHALDNTPRTMGRDLLYLRWWQRGLTVPGGRMIDIHGVPERIPFGHRELMAYSLLGYLVSEAETATGAEIEKITRFRIASAILGELTQTPICRHCETAGCGKCQNMGTVPWSDNKRRLEVDTTHFRWNSPLRDIHALAMQDAVIAERQAAMSFMGTLRGLHPELVSNLLRHLAGKR